MNPKFLITRSVPQIAVQFTKRLPKQNKKEISPQLGKRSLVIDHCGTPISGPTSFKHSRALNDTTWPRFEPAPLPSGNRTTVAVVEACVGLPSWLN